MTQARHAFDLTAEQLKALAEPWDNGELLAGLPLLQDVAKSARPVRGSYRVEDVWADAWVVAQQVQGGLHRAVVFNEAGRVLAQYAHEHRYMVQRWLQSNTEQP